MTITKERVKKSAPVILMLVTGFISWYFLHLFFYQIKNTITIGILAIFFLIFWGASFSIATFFVRTKRILWPAFGILSAAPFFLFGFDIYFLAAGLGFFLAQIFSAWIMQREVEEFTLKMRTMYMLKKALPFFYVGLSFLVVTVFYFSPLLKLQIAIPRSWFNFGFARTESLVLSQLPGFNPEMNVNEFLAIQYFFSKNQDSKINFQNDNFIKILRNPEFLEFSGSGRLEDLILNNENILRRERENLSKNLGIEIKGDEKVKDLLYFWINSKILNIHKPDKGYASLWFILVTFLALQALNPVYKHITGLFAWLMVALFSLSGLAKKEKVMAEREILTL